MRLGDVVASGEPPPPQRHTERTDSASYTVASTWSLRPETS
jgi:hypothetical protein